MPLSKKKTIPKKNRVKPYPNKKKVTVPRPRMVPIGRVSNAPLAQTTSVVSLAPQFTRAASKITIRHRELFDNVSHPGTYTTTGYNINPGNPILFPWLSTQASGWERYRFKKLVFDYVPRCGTSQLGTVILAIDFDASDNPPVNEFDACSYSGAVNGAPWQNLQIVPSMLQMDGGVTSKFVRVGAGAISAINADIKTMDVGVLYVITGDFGAGSQFGKIWVTYEIELMIPQTRPIPLTSGFSVAGSIPAVTPLLTTANTYTQAGPLLVGANSSDTAGVSGLIPGQDYLVQFFADGTTPATTTTSTVFSALTGVTEKAAVVANTSITWAANLVKAILLESVFTATANAATFKLALAGAALKASQLVISPVVPAITWSSI